jgi:hypothetical protein
MAAGANALAFQLIAYFYPAVLCGAFTLAGDARSARAFALALALVTIAQRLPRFVGAVDRYALHQNPQLVFGAAEVERLTQEIGAQPVRIDVAMLQPGILLLVELGRRHVDLQWSPQAWDTVLHYRGWPLPPQPTPPAFILRVTDGGMLNHFELVRDR